MSDLAQLAIRHDAYVRGDNDFQRRARILQSIWRENQSYPIGKHRCSPFGSRLPMPWAQETLANYLTDSIRGVVRREVLDPIRSKGKLFSRPRIFNNLLSSQPLCFNLFGELQRDLTLATAVFRDITKGRVGRVEGIEFEYSPGRRDLLFLGDKSAFDIYVAFVTPSANPGFIGIEVKYHEDMDDSPGKHHSRYDEVAAAMGCFAPGNLLCLREKPLQQIWRDHLLAGSLLDAGTYESGFFALLYPRDNSCCSESVDHYRACLLKEQTFTAWTIEEFVVALKHHTQGGWVQEFSDRYLAFAENGLSPDRCP